MANRLRMAINRRINEESTQVQLALKSGIKQGQITSYLSGKTNLSNAKLQTLTKLFPEFEYYLFNDEKTETKRNLSDIENEIVRNLKQLSNKSQLELLTNIGRLMEKESAASKHSQQSVA